MSACSVPRQDRAVAGLPDLPKAQEGDAGPHPTNLARSSVLGIAAPPAYLPR